MSRIRGKDTAPERAVRSYLHRAGMRFRIHVRALPGTPDLVIPSARTAVFVHGCWWHQHESTSCPHTGMPRINRPFWQRKFDRNRARDERRARELRAAGWSVQVVWECEVTSERRLARLLRFARARRLRLSRWR